MNPITRLARWWLRDDLAGLRGKIVYFQCELERSEKACKAWIAEAQDAKNASKMHQTIANNFQNAQTNWHDDIEALYRDAYPRLTKERKDFWKQKIGLPS